MFYRHNKTFWYKFCNFKHFLKAGNSDDSLASSCEEFCILAFIIHVTQTSIEHYIVPLYLPANKKSKPKPTRHLLDHSWSMQLKHGIHIP